MTGIQCRSEKNAPAADHFDTHFTHALPPKGVCPCDNMSTEVSRKPYSRNYLVFFPIPISRRAEQDSKPTLSQDPKNSFLIQVLFTELVALSTRD